MQIDFSNTINNIEQMFESKSNQKKLNINTEGSKLMKITSTTTTAATYGLV